MAQDPSEGQPAKVRRYSVRKMALLMQFPFEIIAVTGLGLWADLSWGTQPWCTVGAFFVGLTFALIHLFASLK